MTPIPPLAAWISFIVGVLAILSTTFWAGWNLSALRTTVGAMKESQEVLFDKISDLETNTSRHEQQEGHPGISTRLAELTRRVERIEDRA